MYQPHAGDASCVYTGPGGWNAMNGNTPRADTPQNWRFMPRSAPPGAPPAAALYQVSAYGCASTTSVAAASAMKPPTTLIATRSAVFSATGRTATAYLATSRPAHTPPTPAAMHSVGSAGI